MIKDEILTALPLMSHSDLMAIHAMAGHLLQPHPLGGNDGASTLAPILFDALQATAGGTVPYASVALTKTGKLLIKNAPNVEQFFNKHFKGWDKNKIVKLAFIQLMTMLLSDDLKERGVTPTLGIMVANLNRLPEVFRNAFPGYLETGVGPLLLKKLTSASVVRNNPRRI